MRDAYSLLWGIIAHPVTTLSYAAVSPPYGISVALLFLFGLCWGLIFHYARWMRGLRKRSETPSIYLSTAIMPPVILAVWSVLAAATLALAHICGASGNFERLFCLLALTSLPKFCSTLTYPLRCLNWASYRIWQAFALAMLCWMTSLVGIGLYYGLHLLWWKALITSLPIIGLLWAAGIAELKDQPDTFIANYRWKKKEGERVVVFTPRSKSTEDIDRIVIGCDATLEKVEALLQVEPLKFKVYVFLFSDKALLARLTQMKENRFSGLAHGDSISIVYDTWENIKGIVAHEFCHVLREQRITRDLSGLLDEGLAVYITERVAPSYRPTASYTMPTPLRVLAYSQIFFDWIHSDETDYSAHEYYHHAYAFVEYLIERSGLEKFKQLCRHVGSANKKLTKQNAGERLANATKEIYGVTLKQMEEEWRGAMELYRMLGSGTH